MSQVAGESRNPRFRQDFQALEGCALDPSGESGLNYQGCDIYRFDTDNKIVHKNTFWKIVEHKDRL